MSDWIDADEKYLPIIEKTLKDLVNIPEEKRYEEIVNLVSSIILSSTERLKFRNRLKKEFGFPVRDFDQVFSEKAGLSKDIGSGIQVLRD